MNLVEALREVAPLVGAGAPDDMRAEAARILHEALRHLARDTFRKVDPSVREDIASEVLVRLMNNGPRGIRTGDPDTPAAVTAWLRRAVANGVRDWYRRNRRDVQIDDWASFADVAADPADEVSRREGERALVAAEGLLFDEIVPELGARLRGGPLVIETVQCLRDIRDGRTTMRAVLEREAGGRQDPAEERRARNRLDQRFSRALARLHDEVDVRLGDGRISIESGAWVRRILVGLKLRG